MELLLLSRIEIFGLIFPIGEIPFLPGICLSGGILLLFSFPAPVDKFSVFVDVSVGVDNFFSVSDVPDCCCDFDDDELLLFFPPLSERKKKTIPTSTRIAMIIQNSVDAT